LKKSGFKAPQCKTLASQKDIVRISLALDKAITNEYSWICVFPSTNPSLFSNYETYKVEKNPVFTTDITCGYSTKAVCLKDWKQVLEQTLAAFFNLCDEMVTLFKNCITGRPIGLCI